MKVALEGGLIPNRTIKKRALKTITLSKDEVKAAETIMSFFRYEGSITSIIVCHQGHINDTFPVFTTKCKYLLQRVSPTVFEHPEWVMSNIILLTHFLRGKIIENGGNPEEECLNLMPTKDGQEYVMDSKGECWRLFNYVDGKVYDSPENEEVFSQAGVAFGHFQHLLKDFPAEELYEVLPHFHDTPKRYKDFEEARRNCHSAKRLAEAQKEIEFVTKRKNKLSAIEEGLADGTLPKRVTHNDTKLNNIMFDKEGKKPLCILDLDTIMVGSPLFDFGDAIRYGANTAAEDEKDTSKIHFSLPMYKAYAKGFVKGGEGALTKEEIALMPYASELITYECGLRFLTDFLNGDTYFHTDYDNHNLVRAKDQFALLVDMETKEEEMKEFGKTLLK